MLYMEFYNSIFCKCIKDKLINIKSVVDIGFFLVVVVIFFVKEFFIWGWGWGGVVGCE